MLQRQIVVKALGKQIDIEDAVCTKDAIASFDSIGLLIFVNVTIYRTIPLQRYQSNSHCIYLTTRQGAESRIMSIVESFGPTAATIGGGFFVGILIGYALKKAIKLVAVIVGLFLATLAYLQYHQIANINWNKLQTVSDGVITTLSSAIVQIPGFGDSSHAATVTASSSLTMTSFGIPLTGSMSAGFAIGFVKG
jgi:uncharacterized membrane protein (Fun14 family)